MPSLRLYGQECFQMLLGLQTPVILVVRLSASRCLEAVVCSEVHVSESISRLGGLLAKDGEGTFNHKLLL